MATKFGGQYESQFRQPRKEGWESTTSMDKLWQLLGVGSNIAGNVQKKRNKRGDIFSNQMASIVYDQGTKNAPIYERIFNNNILGEIRKDFVSNYGEKVKRGGLSAMEDYKFFLGKFDSAMKSNTVYENEKKFYTGTPEKEFKDSIDAQILAKVDKYRTNWNSWDDDTRNNYVREIRDFSINLGKKNQEFKAKYLTKLANDPN